MNLGGNAYIKSSSTAELVNFEKGLRFAKLVTLCFAD